MHLDAMITYRLELKPEELKLVCDGLRSLATPEAKQFNCRLMELRAKQHQHSAKASADAWQSALDENAAST